MQLKNGQMLPILMKEARLNLRQLSEQSGAPISTLSEWHNKRNPRAPIQIAKVERCLGVSLHHLLFGEEDHQEPLQKVFKEEVFKGTYEISTKKVKGA